MCIYFEEFVSSILDCVSHSRDNAQGKNVAGNKKKSIFRAHYNDDDGFLVGRMAFHATGCIYLKCVCNMVVAAAAAVLGRFVVEININMISSCATYNIRVI